ncbi:hypothetical protein EOM82_09620, partial [bacterium]|nr:hypothetical protein [bacterium]
MEMELEYSLSDIFSIIFKRFWVIVLCVILGTSATFLVTKYVIQEEFTASVSMYVAPNKGNVDLLASLNDLNYAQKVVDTYIEILRTNTFMKAVAETSNLGYSANDISKMVVISPVKNTEI